VSAERETGGQEGQDGGRVRERVGRGALENR
jgi:hypothetical protein